MDRDASRLPGEAAETYGTLIDANPGVMDDLDVVVLVMSADENDTGDFLTPVRYRVTKEPSVTYGCWYVAKRIHEP